MTIFVILCVAGKSYVRSCTRSIILADTSGPHTFSMMNLHRYNELSGPENLRTSPGSYPVVVIYLSQKEILVDNNMPVSVYEQLPLSVIGLCRSVLRHCSWLLCWQDSSWQSLSGHYFVLDNYPADIILCSSSTYKQDYIHVGETYT